MLVLLFVNNSRKTATFIPQKNITFEGFFISNEKSF